MISQEERRNFGEVVDRLVTLPIFVGSTLAGRPIVLELYDAARAKFGEPLTFLATDLILKSIKHGGTAILTTGFIVPPWLRAETDGPIGALTLSRALNILGVTPLIITEEVLVDDISRLCMAAGFEVCDPEKATRLPRRISVRPFTHEVERAEAEARKILDEVKPSVVIAIEKASRNEKGEYHSGIGVNITSMTAKVDFLITEARKRGIPTIGIGDGGNEIGMGCIKEAVKKISPTGTQCKCPCGAGTHAATETDVLVVAAVSNWGAYGIEACIGHALQKIELLHSYEMEELLLEESGRIGFIDPASGFGEPWADHIPKKLHSHLIDMLKYATLVRIREDILIQKYREYATERLKETIEIISRWRELIGRRRVKDW
jgi:hypothetical protein